MLEKHISRKNIFFVDGIGALTSALFLGIVLVQLESYFGMPVDVLYLLALLALLFSLYSIANHIIQPKKWKSFLQFVAIANSLYCLLTAGLVIYFFYQLTVLGITYFLGELMIIAILVRAELSLIQSK